jgi:hypothetical protein
VAKTSGTDDKIRCEAQVFKDFHTYQCSNGAKVQGDDGKFYCGIHDPAKVEAKRKARDEKWERERQEWLKENRRQRAMEKACEGVPTEILAEIKVKDLLEKSGG